MSKERTGKKVEGLHAVLMSSCRHMCISFMREAIEARVIKNKEKARIIIAYNMRQSIV
jgi:hypothetical protein